MNYLGTKQYTYKDCNVVVLPYGKDDNVSYGKGAKNGPQAIIRASQEVELHPFPSDLKIHTMSNVKLSYSVLKSINDNKFVLTLGGDHSITPDIYKHYNTDIVQFDAHSDLRDIYDNNKNSHACAMRRCMEMNDNTKLFSFGIRNTSQSEEKYISENTDRIFRNVIPKNKDLYLTFDVDAFDVSLMPATGTPEPGGLLWNETLDLIDTICKHNNIVAIDIVEHSPIVGIPAYDFVTAKLSYLLLKKSLKRG
tara:strand:+ start:454 stop:1206 length:753 start_codon:yes stop_codon:yes gene_type:complete